MPRPDDAWLRDMIDAAREARDMTAGLSREDLDRDRKLALALRTLFAVIGEAAKHVPDAVRARAPLPWGDIAGARDVLVHRYFAVNLDILWETVQNDLPPLIAALDPLVAELGPTTPPQALAPPETPKAQA